MGNVFFGGGKVGMKKPGSRLPDGYTELAYIQSSGTQYIDAAFIPNQNTKIVFDFLSESTDCCVFGSRISYNNSAFMLYWSTTDIAAIEIGSQYFGLGSLADANRHTIQMDGTQFVFDGDVKYTYSTTAFTAPATMRLFHAAGAESFAKMTGKVYACQIYDNGTLARDFVPCVADAGGVGLFDLVNNKFYGNSGSGSFVGGPEVA